MPRSPPPPPVSREDQIAGAIEHFRDAALYDHDYRRRRDDVRFYRSLAAERDGPVLDLACGTGRLMVPLLRDGHTVVGLDHAPAMLAGAAAKLRRLPAAARARALLIRADLRRFAVAERRFAFAVVAFHGIQHLTSDGDLLRFLRQARRALVPGGWLAFDVFVPHPRFLARDQARRWDRTRFRDPTTDRDTIYTIDHRYDARRRLLLMRMHYQPVDGRGRPGGPERTLRLCHRQLGPDEAQVLVERAGMKIIATWGDFAGGALRAETEQHIYLVKSG